MAKTRIVRQEIGRGRVQICEIASPASENTNFLARLSRLLKQQHLLSAPPGDSRAHQARGSRPEYDDVVAIEGGIAILGHSTSSTSTATPSLCLRDPLNGVEMTVAFGSYLKSVRIRCIRSTAPARTVICAMKSTSIFSSVAFSGRAKPGRPVFFVGRCSFSPLDFFVLCV